MPDFSPSDLFRRFLASDAVQSASPAEVELYDAAVAVRAEPKPAWRDATRGADVKGLALPPSWPALVSRPGSVAALPMALGNFPQRVSDLSPLLDEADLSVLLTPTHSAPAGHPLRSWADKAALHGPDAKLVAAGVLRQAGDLDAAETILGDVSDAAGQNEVAALLWERGEHRAALALWNRLPATTSVLFNRGMARLFLGLNGAADLLREAVKALPEGEAWHHLAALYLTLAEMGN